LGEEGRQRGMGSLRFSYIGFVCREGVYEKYSELKHLQCMEIP